MNKLRATDKPQTKKIYVIGDVHGCYHTLKALIEKTESDSRIIFVGDLCDRGLYTMETIEFVIQNGYESMLGNHDDYMIQHAIESVKGEDNRWIREEYMGGKETIQSYEGNMDMLVEHIAWLKQCPRYLTVDNFFITHAYGLPYYKRRDTKAAHIGLLSNRVSDEKEWGYDWEEGFEAYPIINIFGHMDYQKVEVGSNYYGIDTGCVYGNQLSAIELNSLEIIAVKTDSRDICK